MNRGHERHPAAVGVHVRRKIGYGYDSQAEQAHNVRLSQNMACTQRWAREARKLGSAVPVVMMSTSSAFWGEGLKSIAPIRTESLMFTGVRVSTRSLTTVGRPNVIDEPTSKQNITHQIRLLISLPSVFARSIKSRWSPRPSAIRTAAPMMLYPVFGRSRF